MNWCTACQFRWDDTFAAEVAKAERMFQGKASVGEFVPLAAAYATERAAEKARADVLAAASKQMGDVLEKLNDATGARSGWDGTSRTIRCVGSSVTFGPPRSLRIVTERCALCGATPATFFQFQGARVLCDECGGVGRAKAVAEAKGSALLAWVVGALGGAAVVGAGWWLAL
jgi:hypothetical protein